jgi:hypothetical protein
MNLNKIIKNLELKVLAEGGDLDRNVTGAYTSDLLSDVIANSGENQLWITLQTHQNTLAVAKLKDLAGIIIVNDREPEDETRQKAQAEGVALLQTSDAAFVISGRLYQLLKSEEG